MKENNAKVMLDSLAMFVAVFVMIVVGVAIILNGHEWLKAFVKFILTFKGIHL